MKNNSGFYFFLRSKASIKIVFWSEVSGNINAIQLLERNLDKIDWRMLSANKNAMLCSFISII